MLPMGQGHELQILVTDLLFSRFLLQNQKPSEQKHSAGRYRSLYLQQNLRPQRSASRLSSKIIRDKLPIH